jgi:hypothetical protein
MFVDLIPQLKAVMPSLRGRLLANQPLAELTWFRVGGPAQLLFMPEDESDLAHFLAQLPAASMSPPSSRFQFIVRTAASGRGDQVLTRFGADGWSIRVLRGRGRADAGHACRGGTPGSRSIGGSWALPVGPCA